MSRTKKRIFKSCMYGILLMVVFNDHTGISANRARNIISKKDRKKNSLLQDCKNDLSLCWQDCKEDCHCCTTGCSICCWWWAEFFKSITLSLYYRSQSQSNKGHYTQSIIL